jgi:hypothetical protein
MHDNADAIAYLMGLTESQDDTPPLRLPEESTDATIKSLMCTISLYGSTRVLRYLSRLYPRIRASQWYTASHLMRCSGTNPLVIAATHGMLDIVAFYVRMGMHRLTLTDDNHHAPTGVRLAELCVLRAAGAQEVHTARWMLENVDTTITRDGEVLDLYAHLVEVGDITTMNMLQQTGVSVPVASMTSRFVVRLMKGAIEKGQWSMLRHLVGEYGDEFVFRTHPGGWGVASPRSHTAPSSSTSSAMVLLDLITHAAECGEISMMHWLSHEHRLHIASDPTTTSVL